MQCPTPLSVRNRFGQIVHAPCGQCRICLINKSRQWAIRITHEAFLYDDRCCFLTLTYDDDCLPENRTLVKKDFQDWMKRFRESVGTKVRFFMCGEYGKKFMPGYDFGRPHYHICLFGVPVGSDIFKDRKVAYKKDRFGHYRPNGFHVKLDSWKFGMCHVGTLTKDSAYYVSGYVMKKLGKKGNDWYLDRNIIPEFVLMSRRPGIGENYLRRANVRNFLKHNRFVVQGSAKYPMPRYYSDKLNLKNHFTSKDEYIQYLNDTSELDPDQVDQIDKNIVSKLHLLGKDERI